MQELLKNAIFLQQQLKYEQSRTKTRGAYSLKGAVEVFCIPESTRGTNHELCDLGSGPSIYQRFSAHLTSVDLPDLQVISLTKMLAVIR